MGILLMPEELSVLSHNEWVDGRWYYDPYQISKAQLKKVVEWGEEECSLSSNNQPRRRCGQCWEDLLKEAGLNKEV